LGAFRGARFLSRLVMELRYTAPELRLDGLLKLLKDTVHATCGYEVLWHAPVDGSFRRIEKTARFRCSRRNTILPE